MISDKPLGVILKKFVFCNIVAVEDNYYPMIPLINQQLYRHKKTYPICTE